MSKVENMNTILARSAVAPHAITDTNTQPAAPSPIAGETETYNEFYVDIPPNGTADDPWVNVGSFETQAEALEFAQEHFGADEYGRVSLVSPAIRAVNEREELIGALRSTKKWLFLLPSDVQEGIRTQLAKVEGE